MNKDPWCLCHDGESCSRHGVMPFAVRLPTWLCVEIELMAIECLVSNLMWLLNDTHRGIVWRAWRLLSYKIRAQCCGLTCINKLNEILTTGVYRCAFVSDSIYLISRQFMSALSSLFHKCAHMFSVFMSSQLWHHVSDDSSQTLHAVAALKRHSLRPNQLYQDFYIFMVQCTYHRH